MDGLQLHPHPDFPSMAVRAIMVDAGRQSNGTLALRYYVEGDLEAVIWPEFDGTDRADGLWQHTCFEAFVAFTDEPGYRELNFSPSGRWAAYRFDGYRAGMQHIENASKHGNWNIPVSAMKIFVTLPEMAGPREWRLGLSAVIEARDGSKSYWALRHPPGKPDFHNADCFAARIAAPTGA
jgi:hypothetical protein